MNLNQLNYFVTLAHLEHYTKASEILSITQPSLSHAISILEKELGAELFEKRGRNVALTKYGRIFLEYVEEALGVLDAGVKKTRSLTSENEGEIALGYMESLGGVYIPELVSQFKVTHEDWKVRFYFFAADTPKLLQGLKEEKFDLIFCSEEEKRPDAEYVRVGTERLAAVVSMQHELAGRTSVELKEILPYPQIFYTKDSRLRPNIERLFEEAGGMPEIAFEIEDPESMAGLAAQNFGIAIMPESQVRYNPRVKILQIEDAECDRPVYMGRLSEKYVTPVVKEFIKYVKQVYRQEE